MHRNPHCVYVINYYLVWIPRYLKKVQVGPIAERLKNLFNEITAQYGFKIIAVEVIPAHGHLFVSASPKFTPAEIVRYFKGIPSRRLKQEFAYLPHQFCGENATLWAEGYQVGSAGHVSAETIKRNIEQCQKG